MNKIVTTVFAGALAGTLFAAPTAEEIAATHLVQNKRAAHFGGELLKPGSQKGTILFVNNQKVVPQEELAKFTVALAKQSRLGIKIVTDTEPVTPMNAAERKAALNGAVAVFLVECDKCNTMLLNAPEAGWAIVNVTAVTKDARNDVFKAARVRKEMARAFYSVSGAMNSQYEGSLMSCIREAKDLDKLLEDCPYDVFGRTMENLKGMGVTPYQVTMYNRACEQGWAPEPTNDVQKAIWDKVHQKPTKGIEIKYDPKKGK